jgi:hypothetical protein
MFQINVARHQKIRYIEFFVSSRDKERSRLKRQEHTKEKINSDSKEKALC